MKYKREREIKENKRWEKQDFSRSIERLGEWKFCLGKFWPFNAFFMLKTTFGKYQLIKISMTCVYIKLEVKKNDTTEAINEVSMC